MEISFKNRANNWRGRGRPPREPSARALELLRHTAATGTVAVITLDALDDASELKSDLKAAQRILGGKVKYQIDGQTVRFFWEPERRQNG